MMRYSDRIYSKGSCGETEILANLVEYQNENDSAERDV